MSPGKLYTGTSGFAYKEWKGSFYPEDLPDKKMLGYYSEQLPTVEVNYTFRRLPSESTLEGWKTHAAPGFKFTLKASQRITHFKRLKETAEDVAEFVRRAKILGESLGIVLFQLPPNFVANAELLRGFLSDLPPAVRYAFEFRHASWTDPKIEQLLTEHAVARCGAETDELAVAVIPITAPFVYLRLRKLDYQDEEIIEWGKRISPVLGAGHDVFCYFKHEGGGVGPAYANRLIDAVA